MGPDLGRQEAQRAEGSLGTNHLLNAAFLKLIFVSERGQIRGQGKEPLSGSEATSVLHKRMKAVTVNMSPSSSETNCCFRCNKR